MADIFPPEERGTAYGVLGFAWMFGYLLGMMGGGLLVGKANWNFAM
eukprot:SAG31_NODE_12998_length_900_cov_1.756554_1_plen_45_part_10